MAERKKSIRYVLLLEIYHPGCKKELCLTSYYEEIRYCGKTYIPYPYSIKMEYEPGGKDFSLELSIGKLDSTEEKIFSEGAIKNMSILAKVVDMENPGGIKKIWPSRPIIYQVRYDKRGGNLELIYPRKGAGK